MGSLRGWDIDLKAVYGRRWADRAEFHMSEDLWESPDGSVGVLLYAIAEVGVSKEIGRLAAFRRKVKPELVLNLPWLECWHLYESAVQFGMDGVLFVHGFKAGWNRLRIVPAVLDPAARRWAAIPPLAERFWRILHSGGTRYSALAMEGGTPEAVVDLKDLAWRRL